MLALLAKVVLAPLEVSDRVDGRFSPPAAPINRAVRRGSDDEFDAAPAHYTARAYESFSTSFLAQPLPLFEGKLAMFSQAIDMEALSSAALSILSSGPSEQKTQDELLWLLSHFVALRRSQPEGRRSSIELKALYALLSIVSGEIRLRFPFRRFSQAQDEGQASAAQQQDLIPPFIAKEIASLVDQHEISQLLDKFTL